jgi:hypothetical protein
MTTFPSSYAPRPPVFNKTDLDGDIVGISGVMLLILDDLRTINCSVLEAQRLMFRLLTLMENGK